MRFIYKGDTSTHAEGTDPRGGLGKRARVRRHYDPHYTIQPNSILVVFRARDSTKEGV